MTAAGPGLPDNSSAPSAWLPLRFVLLGIVSLLATAGLILARPELLATYHYNQYIVAVSHLFVLGFLLSVVMGTLYQMAPVVLEVTLHSERLGRWHFGIHSVALVGMIWSFWRWELSTLIIAGSGLTLGLGLFTYNLARTLRKRQGWDLAGATFVSTLSWLIVTSAAGLVLAASKVWAFNPFNPIAAMHAHVHLGILGVFVVLLVGISFRLLPMFLLVDLPNPRRAACALLLLNLATLTLSVTILIGSPWKLAGAALACAGLLAYGLEVLALLRLPQRRALDGGLRQFLTATVLLVPTAVLGWVLAWPGLPTTLLTTQLENVYGLLALGGVLTLAIVGMLYKILPFLTWLQVYAPYVGTRRLPSLNDLYSQGLQTIGFVIYLVALVVLSLSTALGHETGVRLGSGLWIASLACFAWNVGKILRHALRPQFPEPSGARADPRTRATATPSASRPDIPSTHVSTPSGTL